MKISVRCPSKTWKNVKFSELNNKAVYMGKGNGHGPLKNSDGCHLCRPCLTLITALTYLGKQFLPGRGKALIIGAWAGVCHRDKHR